MTDAAIATLLLAGLALAAWIFVRLHRAQLHPPPPAGAPHGAGVLPLGQLAVAPDRRWLVLPQGQ